MPVSGPGGEGLPPQEAIIDSIDGIVWEARPDFTFTFVSRYAEKLLGYPLHRWLEEPGFWAAHVHPEDRENALRFCQAQSSRLLPHSFEYRMITADGRVVWLRDMVSVESVDGRLHRLRGVMVDISRQKETEELLRQSEQRHRRIIETAEEGVWLIDDKAMTAFVNTKMAAILGYAPAEMLGKDMYYFMDERQKLQATTNLERRARGIAERHDFEFRKKDGTKVWTSLATSPFMDEQGRFTGAVAFVTDITEQRKTTILLSAQRRIFEVLASGDSLRTALQVLVKAIDELVDELQCSIVLLNEEETLVIESIAPGLPEEFNDTIVGAATGPTAGSCGTAAYRKELVIVTDILTDPLWDGFRHLATQYEIRSCWSNPIFSHDGKVLGTFAMYSRHVRSPSARELGLVKDAAAAAALAIEHVRMRDRLQRSLVEAERSIRVRDDFLAIASHELKTPLTPLKMYVQLLQKYLDEIELPASKKAELLRLAVGNTNAECERLGRLISDMLDVSRITAGLLVLQREKHDLAKIVREAASRFEQEAARVGSKMDVFVDGHNQGAWDKARIEQVLAIVITNALKFGAGKPIEIQVSSSETLARITVQDHGIGISDADQDVIFERFRRAASLNNYPGLGLGLYIARQIILAHGGNISVRSKPNEGACFTIELESGSELDH